MRCVLENKTFRYKGILYEWDQISELPVEHFDEVAIIKTIGVIPKEAISKLLSDSIQRLKSGGHFTVGFYAIDLLAVEQKKYVSCLKDGKLYNPIMEIGGGPINFVAVGEVKDMLLKNNVVLVYSSYDYEHGLCYIRGFKK